MPDYGLKIYNDSDTLIIDSVYSNWQLYESGSTSTTAGSETTITYGTATTKPPLIALRPNTSGYVGIYRITQSGNDYTGFSVRSDVSATIYWQAFVPGKPGGSGGYGLRVYNPGSSLVFNSVESNMRIIDTNTATPADDAQETVNHTEDANAYHVLAPYGVWTVWVEWQVGGIEVWRYFGGIKKLTDSSISMGSFLGFHSGGGHTLSDSGEGGYWPALWTILTIQDET